MTQYVACVDGLIVDNGYLDTFVGGRDVTGYFGGLVEEETGRVFWGREEVGVLNRVKEEVCWVGLEG